MQIKVAKADGSIEEYLHTKVIGSINNALAKVDHSDICVAEQLADVITYYLYHKHKSHVITSGEIFSIIQAVLASTQYEDAAVALSEHHFDRKLKRSRIEVVMADVCELADAELLASAEEPGQRNRWDKSRIVCDLVENYDINRQTARTITSMVEEKIFNMGLTLVPSSLVKQLVLSDTAVVLRAQQQLQTV